MTEKTEPTALEAARDAVTNDPRLAALVAPAPGSWGAEALAVLTSEVERAERETTRAPAPHGSHTMLRLDDLAESPLNPRKTFGAMASLVDSVKRVGLVQSLLVRRRHLGDVATNGATHEIVCGHRRARAAREAGLVEVPCEVRELDDAQALEAMLTENGQREGLTHLEQAETFDALRLRGWSVDQIARRLSTTPGTIYGRLQLLHLCPEGKQAVADGRLPGSVAVPLARLPSQSSQAKALDVLFERFVDADGAMQARDAIAWIQRDFTRPLRDAPFSLTDSFLVAGAPSCSTCPKNTKCATPGLFDDFRETRHPVCTDTGCFTDKAKASWKRKAESAAKKGHVVLAPAEGARLFGPDGLLPFGSRYVEAADVNHLDPKKRTWADLAEKADGVVVTYAPDKSLRGRVLYERAALVEALAASGLAWAKKEVERAETSTASVASKAPEVSEEQREADARRTRLVDLVLVAIGASVQKRGATVQVWRALALALAERHISTDVLDVLDFEKVEALREKIASETHAGTAITLLLVVLLRDSDLANGDDLDAKSPLGKFAAAHAVKVDDVALSMQAERLFERKGKAK